MPKLVRGKKHTFQNVATGRSREIIFTEKGTMGALTLEQLREQYMTLLANHELACDMLARADAKVNEEKQKNKALRKMASSALRDQAKRFNQRIDEILARDSNTKENAC